ncbi:MAG: hypothetical protein ISS49_06060 [Anaerolineae bacterium]|nr:hypothetical protein [Anaerolineae bacterium]
MSTHFRADYVDAAVWDWVKSFLTDPAALAEGLKVEQAEREEANKPLRDRLAVVDDLLADNRRQLERALDLYLSGDFDKERLTERKTRLEKTIAALERKQAHLGGATGGPDPHRRAGGDHHGVRPTGSAGTGDRQ